jgi:hypothetical protein
MIDLFCIGIPSVVLVLEKNNDLFKGHFLSNVIKSALPGAIVIVVESLIVFLLQTELSISQTATSTIIVLAATFTCEMVLFDVCAKLDIEDRYRESLAFVYLRFGDVGGKKGNTKTYPAYNICLTHGAGSSIYVGSSGARGERFISATNADLLISGHTHKPADIPGARFKIDPGHGRVTIEPWRYVVCSSWLDYTDYAAKAMLAPTANVEQKIIIHGSEKRIDVIQST